MGFFSSKPTHPLADAKEFKRVLDGLNGMEAGKVLEEVQAWLESLTVAEDLKAEQCLELVLRLDEAAQVQARRFGRDYLTAPRMSRSEEYRLWNCNYAYWTHLIAAYEAGLRHGTVDGKLQKGVEPLMGLVLLRLLMAYAAAIKWTQFRYGPAEGRYWQGAGQVYLAAQARKLDRKGQVAYSGRAETTIEHEYLQILMLHSSSVNNLMPLEVEVAERLIAYLVPQLIFTDQNHPENVYWVDAVKPLPPTRLAKAPEPTATLRFLRPGAALAPLEAIHERIKAGGSVPTDLQLGGQYEAELVLGVIEHLSLNWQTKPPMRSHQRHQVKSRLTVIHGFATIYDRLMHGKSFFEDGSQEEAWVAEDVSVGGMGAQLTLGANDWICIGALVGVQPDGGDNWLVGVIRRFNRGDGRGAVGIQTVGKAPRAVLAETNGLKTEALILDLTVLPEAIKRDAEGVLSRIVTLDLLMESGHFEQDQRLEVHVDGRTLNLQPQAVIERGAEFTIARYQLDA